MKIDDTTGKMFFLVVEDPGNAMYSTWVKYIMADRLQELNLSNDETLADTVEALIGICYLAIVYPQHLLKLVPRPHETWNRIETAIWSAIEIGLLDFVTTGLPVDFDMNPREAQFPNRVVVAVDTPIFLRASIRDRVQIRRPSCDSTRIVLCVTTPRF